MIAFEGFDAAELERFRHWQGISYGVLGEVVDQIVHGSPSPTWNDRPTSDHPPAPGLWAVEPHLARGDIGVKWEELLVVEDHDAYWLDDDVPHLR